MAWPFIRRSRLATVLVDMEYEMALLRIRRSTRPDVALGYDLAIQHFQEKLKVSPRRLRRRIKLVQKSGDGSVSYQAGGNLIISGPQE